MLQPNETNTTFVYVNTRMDYQHRSASLDSICLYDYIRFYRKKPIDANDRKQIEVQSTKKDAKDSRRGRPVSEQESFQTVHPQASSHINIKRTKPVVPVLHGPPIPRQDRVDTRERYCRSIVTLFVPWRPIKYLCDINQTWEQALETRRVKIATGSSKIIDNIQLLQECKKDKDEHLQQVIEAAQSEVVNDHSYSAHNDSGSEDESHEILNVLENIDVTEVPTTKELGGKAEQMYFEKAVQAADRASRFANIKGSNC